MSDKLVIKQGESKTITFTVEDALGTRVDLSEATLLLGVKKDKSEAAYTFSKADPQFDKSQAASGIISMDLTATDTNRPAGIYIGELQFTWSGPVTKKTKDFFLQIKRAVTT